MSIQYRNYTSKGILLATILLLGCFESRVYGKTVHEDGLPSWNESPRKEQIVHFVNEVTDPSSSNFVAPEDRIATFDNDGTLWVEKPMYTHLFAIFDRCRELVAQNSDLKEIEPFKAIIKKDISYFSRLYENHSLDTILGQLLAVPFGGMTVKNYENWNQKWLNAWKHPRFKVGYKQLIYQPMLELIKYLKANDFQIYIFTADEGSFLRLVSEDLYDIPSERVQGSTIRLEYIPENGKSSLIRTYQAQYLNNWSAKPRLINQVIGKRPILAAGNSNGDLEMLQFVDEQPNSLALLVRHTDAEREYQYDHHAEEVQSLANERGWVIVDMKDDWKSVFPSSLE